MTATVTVGEAAARVRAEHVTAVTGTAVTGFAWSCSCGKSGTSAATSSGRVVAAVNRHVDAAFRRIIREG